MKKKSGFTILELAVTVIIIAVIAVVALPMYKHAILKSRFSTVMPMAKAVADAQEIYYLGNNQYALGKEDLDIAPVEAENTQVSLSPADEDEEYIYVAANRTDIPNVRYIMYQKNSPKFASNIHCEADANDEDALWLCEKALHGQKIEKGSLTPGYTTYILTGNLSDGTFLKECEEEQVLEDSSCACGKRTRTSTGCDDLTGKWEYSEWSSCPQELPDETEACGEGLVGTKTRTASCNGNSYEYGEWNTENCAPACKDEDLVLEETCEDGYAKKTRTKTGCGSDGQWEYTEWDESKCCKGAQVLTAKCSDGYENKTRTVTGCNNAEWMYSNWDESRCCKDNDKLPLQQTCSSGCGKQTRTIKGCENGEWKYGTWSTCPSKPATSLKCYQAGYGSGSCGWVYYDVTCTNANTGTWSRTETSNSCTTSAPYQPSCRGFTNSSATPSCYISCYSGTYWDDNCTESSYAACGCLESEKNELRVVRDKSKCSSGYGYVTDATFTCNGRTWSMSGGTVNCVSSMGQVCRALGTIAISMSGYTYCAWEAAPWDKPA